jgi:cyclic pyranopterin phosphate synthase
MLDGCGRNIDYLRVSLTDRCNLRCVYCMPVEGIEKKAHEDVLRFEEVIKVVKACASLGIRKVRYTGGEPLILKGVDELIHQTSLIPSINDISITTNGILLYDMADDLKKAGLNRVNISLDTLKGDKFRIITRGGNINKVISAIGKCLSIGLNPIKINVVLMRGFNDMEVDDFINLTKNLPLHIRFIELMPIGEAVKIYKQCAMSSDEIIESHKGMIPVKSELSSTAIEYRLKNSKGTVGFISPISCKFCGHCNRIRLTSMGTIKPCLHSENEINIKKLIGNEDRLKAVLKDAILAKPSEHHLETDSESKSRKMMYQIGG